MKPPGRGLAAGNRVLAGKSTRRNGRHREFIRRKGEGEVTNEELILYQARRICELEKENRETNESMNFWLSQYCALQAKYESYKAGAGIG